MIVKHVGSQVGMSSVTFVVPSTIWVEGVHLVGDFNDWDRRAHPLAFSEDSWHITLELLCGSRFRFRYLLDNAQWCNDRDADSCIANLLGGYASVLTV